VSHRPLVFVLGLTFGDYLLWSWSLSGNHDVLALVSGLTLPPLAVACLWLLTLSIARLIGRTARRPVALLGRGATGYRRNRKRHSRTSAPAAGDSATSAVSAASADAPAGKLAA
jgi:hypothetical protein